MTINLFGNHLKSVETRVKLNPKKVIDDFKVAMKSVKKE